MFISLTRNLILPSFMMSFFLETVVKLGYEPDVHVDVIVGGIVVGL